MISIKKYLDSNTRGSPSTDATESSEMLAAVIKCYRSALRSMGKNAQLAGSAPACDLQSQLTRLEDCLARKPTPSGMEEVQMQVEDRLERWVQLTADHMKTQADVVKELLLMLAGTAESVGERDQRYASHFDDLASDLQTIAHLEDLEQIRSTLKKKAGDLKTCIDQMAREGQHSLAELRTSVSAYEARLKAMEQLALGDSLTGVGNRRSAEGRMEWYIAQQQTYCVAIIDINNFKQVNDKYGHPAGDDLLMQFAGELQKNMRTTDLVARWGGDEFIVILPSDLAAARPQVERIRQWVLGRSTIQTGTAKGAIVDVRASIGLAQWLPGKTSKQVVEQADTEMYLAKQPSRKRIA